MTPESVEPAPDIALAPPRRRPAAPTERLLRVCSLNIAHGRGVSAHQLFLSRDTVVANLRAIARALRRERPHVVALQEVDAQAFWTSGLNQLEHLGRHMGAEHAVHGAHMKRAALTYGSALLAAQPLHDGVSVTFRKNGMLPPKGFVVACVEAPGSGELIDVVSVHLDPARPALRTHQIDDVIETLRARARPAIVMGDFNCDWCTTKSAVRRLAEACGLHTHMPDSAEPCTFPKMRRRLDWVLASEGFSFRSYRALPDVLSDHQAVVAEITLP